MISTTVIGVIHKAKTYSSIYFAEKTSLIFCIQGQPDEIENCIDGFCFDESSNGYINIWHDNGPGYASHMIKDIIQITCDEHLIIFEKSNPTTLTIWNFSSVSKAFIFINRVIQDVSLTLVDSILLNQLQNKTLEITNLAENAMKVMCTFTNIKNYDIITYQGIKILKTENTKRIEKYYQMPELVKINTFQSYRRTLFIIIENKKRPKFLAQISLVQLRNGSTQTYTTVGETIHQWNGQLFTLQYSKMLMIRPKQRLIRCFKQRQYSMNADLWIKSKQYIVCSLQQYYSYEKYYFMSSICDLTTAKETKILDKNKLDIRLNHQALIEYDKDANLYRIHELNIQ